MIKTKKKFLLTSILSIVAMLCCGIGLILLANINGRVSTNIDMTVRADATYYIDGSSVSDLDSNVLDEDSCFILNSAEDTVVGYSSDIFNKTSVTIPDGVVNVNDWPDSWPNEFNPTNLYVNDVVYFSIEITIYATNLYIERAFTYNTACDWGGFNITNVYADSVSAGVQVGVNGTNLYIKNVSSGNYEVPSPLVFEGVVPYSSVGSYQNITSIVLKDLNATEYAESGRSGGIDNIFSYWHNITSVELRGSSFIGFGWFTNLTNLETITIGEGCSSIGSLGYNLNSLSSITFNAITLIPTLQSGFDVPVYVPAGMKSTYVSAWSSVWANAENYIFEPPVYETQGNIKYQLFDDNHTAVIKNAEAGFNATDLTISPIQVGVDSYSIVGIEAEAFKNKTTLVSVTIPASVASIGADAFAGCTGLTDVTFEGTTVPTGSGISSLPNTVQRIYVPASAMDAYITALGSTLASRVVEPPETGVVLDIILPSALIALILVATIVVAIKKEYNA